jgi:hypothetical protein
LRRRDFVLQDEITNEVRIVSYDGFQEVGETSNWDKDVAALDEAPRIFLEKMIRPTERQIDAWVAPDEFAAIV